MHPRKCVLLYVAILVLLHEGFIFSSYGAVRFDVVGAPSEVINTGRSEVTGAVTLFVRGTGNVTGTSNGGSAQIALTYTNPALQIDNTAASGIRMFFSKGFAKAFTKTASSGDVGIIAALNIDLTSGGNRCVGQVTINMAPGATPVEGDFIRIEGVRGRIDASLANTPGTDLYVDLQSINDPSANNFTPSTVRVAKSFPGMNVTIQSDTLLLCYPTTGKAPGTAIPNYSIAIQEGFPRAFVTLYSTTGAANDRIDSGGPFTVINGVPGTTTPQLLGAPINGTAFIVSLEGIPASVASINWNAAVVNAVTKASLALGTSTFDSTAGTATARYGFQSYNQTGMSDTTLESFDLKPIIVLKSGNQTATGEIKAAVTMAPVFACASGCTAPSANVFRPRFLQIWQSKAFSSGNVGCNANDPTKLYAQVTRCPSGPPGKATLLSPSGIVRTSNPTYTWTAVQTASWYLLWLNDSMTQGKINQWIKAADGGCGSGMGTCSLSPNTALANGSCQWWIQTWNEVGVGPWSDGMGFTVALSGPPGKATLIYPTGSVSTASPTYQWSAAFDATWYYLWVDDSAGTAIQQWYGAAETGCASGTGKCSVTPNKTLVSGAGRWWIQTWNSAGYGPWSDELTFTIPSGLPRGATLISPSGAVSSRSPTYVWNAVASASYYYLWVSDAGSSPRFELWFTATQAGCPAGSETCSVTPGIFLSPGVARWWIQTWNNSGYGPWSAPMTFTVL